MSKWLDCNWIKANMNNRLWETSHMITQPLPQRENTTITNHKRCQLAKLLKVFKQQNWCSSPSRRRRSFPWVISPSTASFIGIIVMIQTIVMLKDEIESLIKKGKLVKHRCYCNWHDEGGKKREQVHSCSPW